MMFLSGFASLVYQILWMRQLGLLFGNTSHAAAATLAAFFGGLAVGSWFWGRKSRTIAKPMLAYAWLEVGIAFTALLYFAILGLFSLIYPTIYQSVDSASLLLAVKFLLALLLVFPPAFFMGGTVPMLGQAVIENRNEFGVKTARLYALNILGAAAGVYAASFLLIPQIGYRLTCVTAIAVTAMVAAVAWILCRTHVSRFDDGTTPAATSPPLSGARKTKVSRKETPAATSKPVSAFSVYAVCFLSGFGFLVLEVLWTRLLAQIHVNSVYSFSAVLMIVLVALAIGAALASGIARLSAEPVTVLSVLLLVGGTFVAVSPFVFMHTTGGFSLIDAGGTMTEYLFGLLKRGSVVIGLPALILGAVFPFLMKIEESFLTKAGASIGRLSAINTIGAILGSLLCGFLFLKHLGMWQTMQLTAALYVAAGFLMTTGRSKRSHLLRLAGAVVMVLLFSVMNPASLRTTAARPTEKDLEIWETSGCTISVVEDQYYGCVIKVNSNYTLGSTGAARQQHHQGLIPLLAFPETKSVFFIGVGSGISTGGALSPRVKSVNRVVASELIPEVIQAAEKYMTRVFVPEQDMYIDFTNGLFQDKRVKLLAQDGRHHLMASGEKFDMVNGDLFLPYQSGTGSLYSREHFENVKDSLNPGGVFVQWLPMYQLTDYEFGSIARTMLEVFGQVTMWRNNFDPGQEVVALVGHRDATPLPACSINDAAARLMEVAGIDPAQPDELNLSYDEDTVLAFYCGNITAAKQFFDPYPLNTEDRPVIEYASPLSMHRRVDGLIPTIVGPRYEALIDRIQAICPPDTDPMLTRRTPANRRLVAAGTELYRSWLGRAEGNEQKAYKAWTLFLREWTDQEAAGGQRQDVIPIDN